MLRVSVPTPFAEKMSTVIRPNPMAASEITLGGLSPQGFSKVSGLVGPAGVFSQEMLRVKIYRMQVKPEVIGELRFDGKRVTTSQAKDEQDKKLLKRLLRRPAILRGGLVNDVYAKDNPALFLRLLCETYRSHFFWASEAEAALT